VKTANKLVELILRNAHRVSAGIYCVEDDGVLNPANVRLTPGAIIPIAVGSKGLIPVLPAGDFDVSHIELERLQTNIRRSFYVMRIAEQPDMSATEYQGRVQQQLREQRGVYGQLKGFVEQIMLCVLELARLMGKVKPEEYEKLAQVELTGPLAADIRGLEVGLQKLQSQIQQTIVTMMAQAATDGQMPQQEAA
jgi:hypothetical protein